MNMNTKQKKKEKKKEEATNISRKETNNDEKVALTEKKIRLTLTNFIETIKISSKLPQL